MKKFFVSKDDISRVMFIKKAFMNVKPTNFYILCEKEREDVYKDFVDAVKLPLKELNKSENWITFVNTLDDRSMLVIDNILKFIFFGDGKKEYLKAISQKINHIIVTDVVPFYTEPAEIFYPFWFLGKEILGYNSYNTFKANHLEERKDGEIFLSHSFEILRDKIKDHYVQDYDCFFRERHLAEFEMNEIESKNYEERKSKESENFVNPVKLYNACSEQINLIESRFNMVNRITEKLLFKKTAIVINCLGPYPKMYLKRMANKDVDFLTVHSNPKEFTKYDFVILAEMPIVKPHNWMYIEPEIKGELVQLKLTNSKLEDYFYNKIFNNELRKQFDTFFYRENMQGA